MANSFREVAEDQTWQPGEDRHLGFTKVFKADITNGFDGESVRSAECDEYDAAMDWIRENGKAMSRHFQDKWWCSSLPTNGFKVVIDFGSHRFFGRVEEVEK